MTRLFDATGVATATTIVEAGPCFVTQIKTLAQDGYEAVQLGFDQVRDKKLNSPERGHLKASGAPAVRALREVPVSDLDEVSLGERVDVGMLPLARTGHAVSSSLQLRRHRPPAHP